MASRVWGSLTAALDRMPDHLKWIGSLVVLFPLLWALVGVGWAGFRTSASLDVHRRRAEEFFAEMRDAHAIILREDSTALVELRETNRLLRCNLLYTSDLA